MTVKLSSLRRSAARENDGDWQDVPTIPGVRLKVRSINYGPYTAARDIALQKLRRQHGGKPIPQDILIAALGALYAEHLLLGWEGFDEAYSSELAGDMMGDPLCSELIGAVETAAGNMAQVTLEFVEAAAKNSEAPSATT